jgi:hypothetical protein
LSWFWCFSKPWHAREGNVTVNYKRFIPVFENLNGGCGTLSCCTLIPFTSKYLSRFTFVYNQVFQCSVCGAVSQSSEPKLTSLIRSFCDDTWAILSPSTTYVSDSTFSMGLNK